MSERCERTSEWRSEWPSTLRVDFISFETTVQWAARAKMMKSAGVQAPRRQKPDVKKLAKLVKLTFYTLRVGSIVLFALHKNQLHEMIRFLVRTPMATR